MSEPNYCETSYKEISGKKKDGIYAKWNIFNREERQKDGILP